MTTTTTAVPASAAGPGRTLRWVVLWLLLVALAGGASTLWWMRDNGGVAAALASPWTDLFVVFAICVPFTIGNLGLRWLRWHLLKRERGVIALFAGPRHCVRSRAVFHGAPVRLALCHRSCPRLAATI